VNFLVSQERTRLKMPSPAAKPAAAPTTPSKPAASK